MSLYPLALRLDGPARCWSSAAARWPPAGCRRCWRRAPTWCWSRRGSPRRCGLRPRRAGSPGWSARFTRSDVDGAWLVQVAVDDPAAAAEVSAAAADQRIFCVRADDRDAATAWTPAVTRHGPVTVAVTDDGDRRRALAVRDLVAAALDAGHAPDDAARAGRRAGRHRARGSGADHGEGPPAAGRRPTSWSPTGSSPARCWASCGADAEFVDAAKIPYGPSAAQDEINRILVDRARAGKFVVRLKGGDPYVFGRGGEEALACAAPASRSPWCPA